MCNPWHTLILPEKYTEMHKHQEGETANTLLTLIYGTGFALMPRIIYLHLKGIDVLFTSQITDYLPGNI